MYWKHEPILSDEDKAALKVIDKLWEAYYAVACSDRRIAFSDSIYYKGLKDLLFEMCADLLAITSDEMEVLYDLCVDTGEPPSMQIHNVPAKILGSL